MYLKLNEKDMELIKVISSITSIDYELEGNMLPEDSIIPMLNDLVCELHYQQEQYDDLLQDRDDNWRRMTIEEQLR